MRSKSYRNVLENLDRTKVYPLSEALPILLGMSRAKFTESVDVHIKTNLKGTKGPQSVRGAIIFSKPVSKGKSVLVLTEDEAKLKQAQAAGADRVGGKEIVDEIKQAGGINYDVIIATTDFMRFVAPVAKILGPKGLMPSPKNGTVTDDVDRVVQEFKAGKSEFRMDRTGVIHQAVGNVSFTIEELEKNIRDFVSEVQKHQPEKVKGEFVKHVYLSLTQSPSIKIKL
ncbi:MAG: ribosomal protein [Candidatus Parcubacteria bacterium]|jgi:large subunit ribosomal protein L1